MSNNNNSYPCPFCAEYIDISAESCIYCGEKLTVKTCQFCAENVPKNMDICPFCDSSLKKTAMQQENPPAQKVKVLKKIRYPVVTVLLIIICSVVYFRTFTRSNKEVWVPQEIAALEAENAPLDKRLFTGAEPDIFRTCESSVIFDQGGLTHESVLKNGEYYRLIASLFIHFSLIHLLCNMFVLFPAGKCVENLFGWWRFIGIYLISGIGGGMATLIFAGKNTLSAGASGAVFGLIGAVLGYLLRHHHELPSEERNKLYVSAAWFFVANTILAMWFNSASASMKIGIEAHTGGFIAGLLAGLVLASKLCRQEELSEFAEDL